MTVYTEKHRLAVLNNNGVILFKTKIDFFCIVNIKHLHLE
jgi:hypothetical protein